MSQITKKLVRGRSHDFGNKNSYGICPHCLKEIDELSETRCGFCGKPVAWIQQQLTIDEKNIDKEDWDKNKGKVVEKTGIKLCPFCGDAVGQPRLKLDSNVVALEIGCWNCGIYFNNPIIRADIKSINKCSDELIKKWNDRA